MDFTRLYQGFDTLQLWTMLSSIAVLLLASAALGIPLDQTVQHARSGVLLSGFGIRGAYWSQTFQIISYAIIRLLDVRRRNPHALWWARPGVPYDGIFWDQGCQELILSARVYRRYHKICIRVTSRGKFYYCSPLLLIPWVRTGYPCWTVWPMSHLGSTTGYYLLVHPLSNYVRLLNQLQHTDEHTEPSRHYPLPKSQYTPLLRNPSRRARPQRYSQQLPPNHILPPRLHSYTRPRT